MKVLVSGKVEGTVLKSKDAINFLGTVDKKTGIISDKNHDLYDKSIKDTILVFPSGFDVVLPLCFTLVLPPSLG